MSNLKNKTALITGSSSGIGLEIAKKLHSQGANVIITGSNPEKIESACAGFSSNAFSKQFNLSDIDGIDKFYGDCEALTGQIDILVCNAGITKDNLSLRMSVDDFQKVIDLNLVANFALNKLAVRKMLKQKWGRIINISSIIGVTGNPGQANYAASKAGMIAMTKSLAMEVAAKNITINSIAPGFIETAMTDKLNEAQKEAILQKIPCKKIGKPEDIANLTAFIAGEESSYITGQTLHVNGGMFM